MAIGRITGQMLSSTLNRDTTDLKIATTGESNLFVVDATNDRIGVGVASPTVQFETAGSALIGTDLTVTGNLTVNGSTTTINTTNLTVDDKNIELAHSLSGQSPTDAVADGGGLILKGDTDHTILWSNSNNSWDFSENVSVATGSAFQINQSTVLDANNLTLENIQIAGNVITSASNADISLQPSGTGNVLIEGIQVSGTVITGADSTVISFGGNTLSGVGEPTGSSDVATKNYVDTQVGSANTLTIGDSASGSGSINLNSGQDLEFRSGNSLTLTVAGNGVTAVLNDRITVDEIAAKDSSSVSIQSPTQLDSTLQVAGASTFQQDIVISSGSITSASGTIDFGNEILTTTGDVNANDITLSGNIDMTANASITIGSGDSTSDFIVNFDGTDAYITKSATSGETYIRSRNFSIQNNDGTQTFITGGHGGGTELYHGGVAGPALTTTVSGGISIPNGTLLVNVIASGDSTSVRIDDGLGVDGSLDVGGTFTISNGQGITAILDEDNMASNSDSALATQQSIKAYVDSVAGGTITLGDSASNSGSVNINAGQDLEFRAGNSITPTVAGNGVTLALDSDITINSITSADSTFVRINDSLETEAAQINSTLTVDGDAQIKGNLTVQGTTTYIETTNTKVSDPLLLLNNGNSGGSDIDSGIMVERGSAGNNAVFYWNEGDDRFKAVLSTSAESATSIADDSYATLNVGGLVMSAESVVITSILDEDNFASNSATALATQQSIKAYVDSVAGGTITLGDTASNSGSVDINAGQDLEFRSGDSLTLTVSGNGVTAALNDNITVNQIGAKDSTAVSITSPLQTGTIQASGNITVNGGTVSAGSGSSFGDVSIGDGSITSTSGTIDFGDENLDTTGNITATGGNITGSSLIAGTLTISDGSINDTDGSIGFNDIDLDGIGVLTAATVDTQILRSTDSTKVNVQDSLEVDGSLDVGTNFTISNGTSVNAILDEDDMTSDSATALATQQSIKAYVDSQVSASNTLTIGDDGSTEISLNLDDVLNVKGGNSITSSVAGDSLTFALDDNITVDQIGAKDSSSINITSPIQVTGNINTDTSLTIAGSTTVDGILDEDNFASNSATKLATQQSIKAYVDSVAGGTITLGDSASNSGSVNINSGQDLEFRSGDSITMTVSGNGVTADLNETISVDTITAGDSTAITMGSPVILNSTLKFNGDAQAITQILDEDNFGSDSATALATQQSIKAYVDAVAEGLHVHAPAKAATTDSLTNLTSDTVTYNNGTAGVGATLTLSTALTTLDGYTLQNGDRIIVKDESNQAHNGVYTWATGGTVLTRATDMDTPTEAAGGDFLFVQEGTLFGDAGFVQTETVTTIGSDNFIFVQFSGAGQIVAGAGLAKSGNELSVNVDDSTIEINADTLRVKDAGITNAKLAKSTITLVGDDSTGTAISLGETFKIAGGDSLNSTVSADTLTVNLDDNITVNQIGAKDSTAVSITSALQTTSIQSSGAVNVNGTFTIGTGSGVTTILDEDTLSSDSDTALATQQSIKAYVDSQVAASNTLTLGDDASSEISLNLDDVLNVKGGNSITSSVAGDSLTFALDDRITVDEIAAKDSSAVSVQSPLQLDSTLQVAGTGTIGSIQISGNVISSTDSTQINFGQHQLTDVADPTQASDVATKSYVDSATSSIVTQIGISDSASNRSDLTLGTNDLEFRQGDSITPTVAGTGVTFNLNDNITVNQIGAKDSTAVSITSNTQVDGTLQVSGTSTLVGNTTIAEDITIASGSITSGSGSISFGNENLTTTGNITGSNITATGNVQVNGDLTVSGTTTSVNSTNITVSDPLLILSETNSGGADVDSGIMIERGSAGNNAALYWNEGDDKFKAVLTTSQGDATSIVDTSVATIVANIESTGSSVFGDITVNQIGANDSSAVSIVSPLQTSTIQASGNITVNGGTVTAGSGSSFGDVSIGDGSITSTSGTIDFGDENLTTTGTITATGNTITGGTVVAGTMTLTSSSIDDSGGSIGFNDIDLDGIGVLTAATLDTQILRSTDSTSVNVQDGLTVDGNVDVGGTFTISNGTGITAILDEDTMSSDSATALATQQSIKAYVDTQVSSVSISALNDIGDVDSASKQDGDILVVNDDSSNVFTVSSQMVTGMRLPSGTTAQRPPIYSGVIRYNTTTGFYEGSTDGSTWSSFAMAGNAETLIKDVFSGDGGATYNFSNITDPTTGDGNNGALGLIVYIDNVLQEPTQNYTVSPTAITFDSAVHSGARIVVIQGFDGGAGGGTGGGAGFTKITNSDVDSAVETIDSWTVTTYRAAHYHYVIENDDVNEYQTGQLHVIHDGTTALFTEFGTIKSPGEDSTQVPDDLITFSVDISGSDVRLRGSARAVNSKIILKRVALEVQ